MILERHIQSTLTPFGLNPGDAIRLILTDGRPWEMVLLRTAAEVLARDYAVYDYQDPGHDSGDVSAYGFSCDVRVNGREVKMRREVGTQASFYEPVLLDGVQIWFDAVACIFKDAGGFMAEKDWRGGWICKPAQTARFAIQEAGLSICPEPIRPWFPKAELGLDIRNCYNGEDCWMGPYGGGAAHCGLDVNMPAGTLLAAPFNLDDHYLFHSTAAGFNNTRWRGVRRWADGSEWRIQAHHVIAMTVPERTALKAGTEYATTAGTAVGRYEHTHFMFRVIDRGGEYWLDPWILFWAMRGSTG